jgi:hypothetical protein
MPILGGSGSGSVSVSNVAAPDPGSGAYLTPGSGKCFFSGSRTGSRIPKPYFQSFVTIFCENIIEFLENCNKFFSSGLLFLFLDPGAGMGWVKILIRYQE